MLTREQALEALNRRRVKYIDEIKRHENLDIELFSFDQKNVYEQNLKRFKRELDLTETLMALIGKEGD